MEHKHYHEQSDKSIPTSLPLLEYISNMYHIESERPFYGYKILAVQHLLGSTIPFFTMLEKGGAKAEDIYIVGKAYSSHPIIVERLVQKGYVLSKHAVFDFQEDKPYDSILELHILDSTKQLLKSIGENDKGLIIDDGAKAIRLLHTNYPDLAHRFACVEQTSRGARIVDSLRLACAVINVARSSTKIAYESPVIAKAMVEEFLSSLSKWENARIISLDKKNVLLLGYGFIGEQVARKFLERGFIVSVFDPDTTRLAKAQQTGYKPVTDIQQSYHYADIIVGSSGTPVMAMDDYEKLKPGTLLVNMASTDMEFSAWNLRPRGKIVFQEVLPTDKQYLHDILPLSWRSLYRIEFPSTYIFLTNGGFPSDFSGKINPVPAEDIQLTSALLLVGAIQAIHTTTAGFFDVDHNIQEGIISRYITLKSRMNNTA